MDAIQKLLHILAPAERRAAAWLLVLMFAGMALETVGVGVVIPFVTLLTQHDVLARYPRIFAFLGLSAEVTRAHLVTWAMLALVVIYACKNAFLAYLIWKQTRFSYDMQANLAQRLFKIYLYQPYTFHLQRNSAHLLRNITGEVGMLTSVLMSTFMVITEVLVLVGVTLLLFLVEPLGTLVVAVVLGTAAWLFTRVTRGRILRWGTARQHHDILRVQHLQQGLSGIKDLKLLGREQEFLDQHDLHNIRSAKAAESQATLQQMPRLVLELLAVVGLALLVMSIIGQAERGLDSVVPTLALFAVAAFRLMPSVNRILAAMQAVRFGLPVINTLHGELGLAQAAREQEIGLHGAQEFHGVVQLKNIKYGYAGGTKLALNDVSLQINHGECVGLIGSSGSGKSTLVDVMLGLLTPNSGTVAVDGQDIQRNLRRWQSQIGYVPQSIYLTDDALRNNVAFGLPDAEIDDAAVRRAIKDAQLDHFVADLPDGLDTVVGERGIRLSGGQRQRIGIARALYHDPAVLVLDEATSALDTETERGVMQAVTALRGSKTILVIAHRLTTVEHCDRLYQIENGEVVAEGTPAAVLLRHRTTIAPPAR